MSDRLRMTEPGRDRPQRSVAPRAQVWWYALMVVGGFAFGLIGDRRPFGNDVLAHPFAVFFMAVAVGLIVLRVSLARPVPELIPERLLVTGCLVGGAAFLAGNFIAIRLLAE